MTRSKSAATAFIDVLRRIRIQSESALRSHAPSRRAVGWTLLAWVPMLGWLAAFWPGLLSPDSYWVWEQATKGAWVDLQPPAYTALMWTSLRFGSPVLLTLGQSLLLAASIVAVARAILRLGISARIVIPVAVLLTITPMVGAFSISLWKDIPYSAAVLFTGARVIDLVEARLADNQRGARRALAMIAFWLSISMLMRQNGFLMAGVLFAILLAALPGLRRRVVATGLAVLLVFGVVKLALYPAVGIQPLAESGRMSSVFHDIAALAAKDPEFFSKADRRLLAEVAPFAKWRTVLALNYGCSNQNWLFDPAFDVGRVNEKTSKWYSLWFRLFKEHPIAVIDNRLCSGSIAWNIENVGPQYSVERENVNGKSLGLETDPLWDKLNFRGVRILERLDQPGIYQWVWRAPIWIYLADLAVVVAAIRRRRRLVLLIATPMLAQQLSVAFISPAQDARYMFASLMLGVLLLPIAFIRQPSTISTGQDLIDLQGADSSDELNPSELAIAVTQPQPPDGEGPEGPLAASDGDA